MSSDTSLGGILSSETLTRQSDQFNIKTPEYQSVWHVCLLQMLERQLEGVRPLLADAESAGAQLCDVLSDPASRAEIQGKLAAVNRQYNTLQKKLDLRKAEIEGSLR